VCVESVDYRALNEINSINKTTNRFSYGLPLLHRVRQITISNQYITTEYEASSIARRTKVVTPGGSLPKLLNSRNNNF
jgi:hypothetical protein